MTKENVAFKLSGSIDDKLPKIGRSIIVVYDVYFVLMMTPSRNALQMGTHSAECRHDKQN